MLHIANLKTSVLFKQQSLTAGGTAGASDTLDMRGFDCVKILVHATTSDNATNKFGTLKVQESDTTNATDFTDITDLVGGGVGGFTIPNAPTATTTKPYADINATWGGNRKRYLRVVVSPATTQTISVLALQGRSKDMPLGTTQQNAAVVVNT